MVSRRRTVALVTAAGGVGAVVAVVAVALVITSLFRTTSDPGGRSPIPLVASTPDPIPDAMAHDYAAACPKASRRAGFCPIEKRGQRKWEEIVRAFEGHLVPDRLGESELSDGRMSYGFFASIGTKLVSLEPIPGQEPPPASAPTLWVQMAVPAVPTSSSPSVSVHPASRLNDFGSGWSSGWGIVTVTQADGTVMTVRYWGAMPRKAPLEGGELDVNALFGRAVAALSSE